MVARSQRKKDLLFQAISVMGKAFASPVRLELLDLLAQAPRTVDGLARATGQSNANVSQHLQALHESGWSIVDLQTTLRGLSQPIQAQAERAADLR